MTSASNFGAPWRREDFFGVISTVSNTTTATTVVGPVGTTLVTTIGPFTVPAQILLVDMVTERVQSAGIPGTFRLELRRAGTMAVLRCVIYDNAVGARDTIRISPEGLILPVGQTFTVIYNDDSQGGKVNFEYCITYATFTSGGIE